jgi:TonB family protein
MDALRATTGQAPPDKVANLVWRTLYTQCARSGTSSVSFFAAATWGATGKWSLKEYRGIVLPPRPEPLTEADRANNVQWRGRAAFKYTLSRSIRFGEDGRPAHGSWSKWQDDDSIETFQIKKENNRWLVNVPRSGLSRTNEYRSLDEFASDFARGDYSISNVRLSCGAALATDPFSTLPNDVKPVPKTRSDEVHIIPNSARTDDPPGKIYNRGEPGVSAPVVVRYIHPDYTDEARKARLQGDVTVSVVVDQNGNPQDIKVVTGLGMGLDEKAVETIRKATFRPGMKAGRPVPVRMSVNIHFYVR